MLIDKKAVVLSEGLKTNSTLTVLNLEGWHKDSNAQMFL